MVPWPARLEPMASVAPRSLAHPRSGPPRPRPIWPRRVPGASARVSGNDAGRVLRVSGRRTAASRTRYASRTVQCTHAARADRAPSRDCAGAPCCSHRCPRAGGPSSASGAAGTRTTRREHRTSGAARAAPTGIGVAALGACNQIGGNPATESRRTAGASPAARKH